MTNFKIKSETRKEYEEDAKRYFGNFSSAEARAGRSAEDYQEVESRLPSPRNKQRILERYTKGFSKASRSGSFAKPGLGPAIFPSGLKFASDFIDEMTPKGIKPKEQPKPDISKEAKPTGGFLPKACAVISEICLDCLKPISKTDSWILGIYIITESDALKLWAMHVYNGGVVNYAVCQSCYDHALDASRDSSPVILVADGSLISEHIQKGEIDAKGVEDIELLKRLNSAMPLHTGHERTLGQLNMIKRMDKLKTNLTNYLISLPPDSGVFRNVEQKSGDGQGYSRSLAPEYASPGV
jgi:hypothetical protein